MKIFLSWSGDTSRAVASVLHDWLPLVINELQPFMSSEDIEKGGRGLETIARELQESNFGIVVVTEENHSRPWVNFEAGALSKVVKVGRVVPLLFRIAHSQVVGPLTQFQYVEPTKVSMHALMRDLNAAAGAPLKEATLDRAFEKWWPDLERELAGISPGAGSRARVREPGEMLDELLRLVRAQQRALDHLQASVQGNLPADTGYQPLSRFVLTFTGTDPGAREAFIPTMRQLSENRGVLGTGDVDTFGQPTWTLQNVARELRKVLGQDIDEKFSHPGEISYSVDSEYAS